MATGIYEARRHSRKLTPVVHEGKGQAPDTLSGDGKALFLISNIGIRYFSTRHTSMPRGSLNTRYFLPVLRGLYGQRFFNAKHPDSIMGLGSSTPGTRGLRPYFCGPKHPTHQEPYHPKSHPTREIARRGSSLTPSKRPPPLTHRTAVNQRGCCLLRPASPEGPAAYPRAGVRWAGGS